LPGRKTQIPWHQNIPLVTAVFARPLRQVRARDPFAISGVELLTALYFAVCFRGNRDPQLALDLAHRHLRRSRTFYYSIKSRSAE
jgi:hypothetical protein